MVATTLASAGCLVTNELDFQANQNVPTIQPVSPPQTSYVPSTPDPDCEREGFNDAVRFQALYYDDDVDQTIWALPVVNGVPLPSGSNIARPVPPDPGGSSLHQPPLICVPRTLLAQPCNVVRLFVSDDVNKFFRAVDLVASDPKVDSATWYLGPSAAGGPGSPAMPDISFTDCLPPLDGGT